MQRVTRPRGGINEWLHWLPVSLHKKVNYIIRQIYSRFQMEAKGNEVVPFSVQKTGNFALCSLTRCFHIIALNIAPFLAEKSLVWLICLTQTNKIHMRMAVL